MATTVHELEAKVMSLNSSDRAHLLERLTESFDTDSAIQDAWIAEAVRRESEVLSGKVALVAGSEAIARIRKKIAWATGSNPPPTSAVGTAVRG